MSSSVTLTSAKVTLTGSLDLSNVSVLGLLVPSTVQGHLGPNQTGVRDT